MPEDCLQEASNILLTTPDGLVPTPANVDRASALISLGRELRIGKKNRYSGYASVTKRHQPPVTNAVGTHTHELPSANDGAAAVGSDNI